MIYRLIYFLLRVALTDFNQVKIALIYESVDPENLLFLTEFYFQIFQDAGSTIRERSSTESEGNKIMSTSTTQNSLSRSRSAQSLKILDNQDDKMTILVQLFWICLAVLESDYEHEFLLGLRLLEKILQKLPLDRPDVREKVEKIQAQLKWPSFPGVHSLLLKGIL